MAKNTNDKNLQDDVVNILNKTNSLLEETLKIVKEDRKLALETYEFIKSKGEDDDYISEGALLEGALNDALKLVLDSSNKLTKVLDTVSRMGIAKLRSDTLINISRHPDTQSVDLFDTEQKNEFLENKMKNKNLLNKENFLLNDGSRS